MAKKRYEDTALAKYLDRRILELKPKKTQAEIAGEAGFIAVNMMSMLRSGAAKLPLDRVPNLSRALDCDMAYLMRLALDQTVGSTAASAIVEALGTPISKNEEQWLNEIRVASGNSDPRLTARSRTALRAILT